MASDDFLSQMLRDFSEFSQQEKYKSYDIKYRINRFVKKRPEYAGRQLYIYQNGR